MVNAGADAAFWCLVTVQVLGLASAWLARAGQHSTRGVTYQLVFLGFMGLVGAATVAAMALGPCACLASGTTLMVMVVAAICEFGAAERAATS